MDKWSAKIQAIREVFPNSRFGDETSQPWANTHDWVVAEVSDEFVVWLDNGYGIIALTKGDKLVDYGNYICRCDDVVVLDRDCYGVSKYIWR